MTWIMSECFMPPVAVAPFSSISISSTSSQPVGIERGLVPQEFATVKALAEGPLAGGRLRFALWKGRLIGVGRGGLEPPTYAVIGPERCAIESGRLSIRRGCHVA
jgi:hypothetical protein